ncbi:MAG: 16S rRNA (uracil(1498)-N(3))-methyltransferase [Bacteroidetes bacterium]|nr:16S rRNA (uracil(1498)-N(3))-methyltransferase [Bacteroidota bacterium]
MHTAYHPHLKQDIKNDFLIEEESFHLTKVLRANPGMEICLANGKGLKAKAVILNAHHKRTEVEIHTLYPIAELPNRRIHLAIAPTKNNDRLEWLLEKAIEIGIDEFTLLKCANNERTRINPERLHKIALSAFKQSKRSFLPIINDLISFETFIRANPKGHIAHCYSIESVGTKKTKIGHNWLEGPLLIGPEGDFTIDEVNLAIQQNYNTLDLGENRLRTETAGLMVVVAQALARD